MEIYVTGKAKENFIANQIIIKFYFVSKSEKYDEALENGINSVNDFINSVLLKNGFKDEDLKTKSFNVKEEKEYNSLTNKFDFVGYSYNQQTILKFDYNNELLMKLIKDLNQLTIPPTYQISFNIKDKDECYKRILDMAYNDALEQAKIIAISANKKLINCIKVDYQKSINNYEINSEIETLSLTRADVQNIPNLFVPEDIEISENINCTWIAE